MSREVHVRFCERPEVKVLRPTHPYIAIAAGFVYLAAILDAWSRRVVGYAISRSIDARLAIAALKAAIRARQPPRGCIHHSDRGSQYACLSQAARQPWVHRLDGSAREPLRQCQGRELHEDAEGRGRLFDGLRNVRGCHRRSSPLHRRGLQHTQTTLSARLLEPRAIRGPLRSANGQNCCLILSSPRGALQGVGNGHGTLFCWCIGHSPSKNCARATFEGILHHPLSQAASNKSHGRNLVPKDRRLNNTLRSWWRPKSQKTVVRPFYRTAPAAGLAGPQVCEAHIHAFAD